MEVENEDSNFEIKECAVHLERIDDVYVLQDDNSEDSNDSIDLPSLGVVSCSTNRKKIKSKKTSAEQLNEHLALAQNLKGDEEFIATIEETSRRLETVEIEMADDRLSATPDPPAYEENITKIFCVKNNLTFFNFRDVTPGQCGYENRCHDSFPVHIFEKKMLSFKQVEFEFAVSSFLYAANEYCISDLKSFVTFLLRTLSVHNHISCLNTCYRVLISLLDSHPESFSVTFSNAEIFMLFFNYGVDIDNFKFLSKWSDILKNLEVPRKKNCSEIPFKWYINLKFILKAFIKIISSCTLEDEDVDKIIIFLMWMSRDSSLIKENIYPIVRDCIYVCLENIEEEKWNRTQCNIVNTLLLSMEFSTFHEKWNCIQHMTESIPNRGARAIQLCKQISFSSLRCLCLESNQELDENALGFSINELQFLIQQLVEINNDLLNYASKFVDLCVKNLGASKEEYNMLCNILKQCEASLSDKAQNENTNFLKIYAKLRIFCGQKISFHERYSMCNSIMIKSEYDLPEFNENDYRSNPCISEISDKDRNSLTPVLPEDSESCSTNHSDHVSSLSSKESNNNVHIKAECVDDSFVLEIEQSAVKILIKKKRSSRSSSGNSLGDHCLVTEDLCCENDNLSRQSSEFECHLLNDLNAEREIQNSAVDLEIPGQDIVVSDFSVEYPEETCSSIKVEPEHYDHVPSSSQIEKMIIVNNNAPSSSIKIESEQYGHAPIPSQVEEMDIADSGDQSNKLSSIVENYTNENLPTGDLSPLPEICEVKSIAFSNVKDIENSSVVTSDLLCETTSNNDITQKIEYQSSSLETSFIKNNAKPMLCNQSELEIIAYEGGVSSLNQGSTDTVASKLNILSIPSADKANLLDADEDIIFIKETISPKKLRKTDEKEANIPSPIQRYSEAHPELSITPIKNASSSTGACENLINNEDIVIIEEKTPQKEKPDVIFLKKVSSPNQDKSRISPKINLQTNTAPENIKTQISDEISSKPSVVQVSGSGIGSQGSSSDSDDIAIVEEIIKDSKIVTSSENKVSVIMTGHAITADKELVPNISHLENESLNHQCQDVLSSVLKQVDSKEGTFDSLCDAPNLHNEESRDAALKSTNVKRNHDEVSVVSDVLNSILEQIDASTNLIVENNGAISYVNGTDTFDKSLGIDDDYSHTTEKFVSDLKSNSAIGLSEPVGTLESNLKIGQVNLNESNKCAASSETFKNSLTEFTNKDFNDKIGTKPYDYINPAINSNSVSFNADMAINSIASENMTSELNPSFKNFPNDLQYNNDTISNIVNESVMHVENDLKTVSSDITDVSRNFVKSPVIVNEFISESDVTEETCISRTNVSKNLNSSPFSSSVVSEKSNSNIVDYNETENHNVNKLTVTSHINAINNIVPVAKEIHSSETNLSQKIITDFFTCSPLKKDDSSVLVTNENKDVDNVAMFIAENKVCTVSQDNSFDESVVRKEKKHNKISDHCAKNFKKPSKCKYLSVAYQNKILSTKNPKILLDTLINSNVAKRTNKNSKRTHVSIGGVAKKSFGNKNENGRSSLKTDNSSYISPSSRIQRKRSWRESMGDTWTNTLHKSPRKYSPVKSPLTARYLIKTNSPKKSFNHPHMKQKYSRPSILSKTGANLSNVLRKRIASSLTDCIDNQENIEFDRDDSDVIELYTDPKRYADKECLIVYESEDIVVLD